MLTCCIPPLPDPGLTREPALWTLVSKEPPAPTDGTRDADCDRPVPSVLVRDVLDFEQLSPELEAATAPPVLYLLAYQVPCMQEPRARDPALKVLVVRKRTHLSTI